MGDTMPEYTRGEMREACRNNYNAAIERAAEECDRHAEWLRKEAHAGGDWQHLMTRSEEATYNARCIRALKDAADAMPETPP
jgi:hypothetical protein